MPKPTFSPLASIYRETQNVDTLIRIHNVTGQEFPISGDAYLTRQYATLKIRAAQAYAQARPTAWRGPGHDPSGNQY